MNSILKKMKIFGHKVLIFSNVCLFFHDTEKIFFFLNFIKRVALLDIVKDWFEVENISYCYLSGDISINEKKDEIDRFYGDNDCYFFLISTRAGSCGLNLQIADTVIFLNRFTKSSIIFFNYYYYCFFFRIILVIIIQNKMNKL